MRRRQRTLGIELDQELIDLATHQISRQPPNAHRRCTMRTGWPAHDGTNHVIKDAGVVREHRGRGGDRSDLAFYVLVHAGFLIPVLHDVHGPRRHAEGADRRYGTMMPQTRSMHDDSPPVNSRAIRERLGDGISLRADANCGYTLSEAQTFCKIEKLRAPA